jgi:hypothetical protein
LVSPFQADWLRLSFEFNSIIAQPILVRERTKRKQKRPRLLTRSRFQKEETGRKKIVGCQGKTGVDQETNMD